MKERRAKEYERYKKKFNLTSHSKEIADVLDEEPEVSRFYAELVPVQISPDEFWARYCRLTEFHPVRFCGANACKTRTISRLFFRLQLLTRTGNVNFEEDDEEEELTWEETDVTSESVADSQQTSEKFGVSGGSTPLQPSASTSSLTAGAQQSSHGLAQEERTQFQRKVTSLEEDNQKLRGVLSSLTNRIAQLELDVKTKNTLIAQLQLQLETQSNASKHSSAPPAVAASSASVAVAAMAQQVSDTWSDASSENMSVINHSDVNSSTPYGTDEETSRHGVGGKATLIISPSKAVALTATAALSSTIPPAKPTGGFAEDDLGEDEEEDGWN